MIEAFHKRSEKILNKLKKLEQECYQNEQQLETIEFEGAKQEELLKLSEKLRHNNLTEIELNNLNETIENSIKKFKSNNRVLEIKLLMNKMIEFEAKDSKEFGQLKITLNFNLEFGLLIKSFEGHTSAVTCIEQIEDFSKFITSSDDHSIKIWSTESGKCLKTLTGHTSSVWSLIVSDDKKYLISGSRDKTIKVWNIENDFECVQTLQQEHGVVSLCLLPNNILVCGLYNGTITKWNLNSFTKIDSFKAHEYDILDLKHVLSSQIVSCSYDRKIKLWNLETNECLRTFTGHTYKVTCLEVSSDKSKLYSGSLDDSY